MITTEFIGINNRLMNKNVRFSAQASLVIMLTLMISACSTVRSIVDRSPSDEPSEVVVDSDDITRPPVIVALEDEKVVESNPDETVSFDEWRKQRLEDRKKRSAESNSN
ncbi:MAG: hypothetical protein AAF197_07075 [Pseudomonadota bacterium]